MLNKRFKLFENDVKLLIFDEKLSFSNENNK